MQPSSLQGTRRRPAWILRALIALGVLSVVYYGSWWLHPGSWWLAVLLLPALPAAIIQLLGNWTLYLGARGRRPVAAGDAAHLSVDVFVTACGEAQDLIERALSAACAMRGKHRTWLLDDGGDPALVEMAARLGAGYLTRSERTDAKAGNVNAALARTTGDIVVILDVDHVPRPEFLEQTLGHFGDPQVGFVQVMLTFRNAAKSWVARAAAESSYDFYNPTSIGMDGYGAATLMGSNALIRRSALESIGGYQPGLAEDLATSVALHAAGWRSVYVAQPLAPGLAPPDLTAWFTQQLKWARGVFELLLTRYIPAFPRLTWGQRLAYAVRMTYYLIGVVIFVHLALLVAILLFGDVADCLAFQDYLLHLSFMALFALLIRGVSLTMWKEGGYIFGALWRAVALVYATWPVYTWAWIMALLRLPLGFRHTPKRSGHRLNPVWLLPQVLALLLLVASVVRASGILSELHLLAAAAAVQGVPLVVPLWQWVVSGKGGDRRERVSRTFR